MTNTEALMAECEPYTATSNLYSKKLADAGITGSDTYTSENKKAIALCAISVLVSMLPLSSDGTGHSSQSYSREGLQDRINHLCKENDIDTSEFSVSPVVEVYHNMF